MSLVVYKGVGCILQGEPAGQRTEGKMLFKKEGGGEEGGEKKRKKWSGELGPEDCSSNKKLEHVSGLPL